MVWAIINADQQAALVELQQSKSERVTALLGAAMLDNSLRHTLEFRLRSDKDISRKVLKPSGALGNLGPKIDLGYLLHMYDASIRNAMYGISAIRNAFAHNLKISFYAPIKEINDAFDIMKLHEGIKTYQLPSLPEDDIIYESGLYDVENVGNNKELQFIVNLKLCLMWLMGDKDRHLPHFNQPTDGEPPT